MSGIVAVAGDPELIVGHALFARDGERPPEVAFEVADEWQGRGLGTLLLGRLAALARAQGFDTLTAVVLPANRAMIQVFRDSGLDVRVHAQPGELQVDITTDLEAGARQRFEERDRIATAAAIGHFLEPASVALIGASRRRGAIGWALKRNLQETYTGPLHLLGKGESVCDVDGEVDLAVIAVAADQVERDRARVRREGREGAARHLRRVRGRRGRAAAAPARGRSAARRACGWWGRTASAWRRRRWTRRSRAAARCRGVSRWPRRAAGWRSPRSRALARHGIGFSGFVSLGDRADLSSNDFLQYWEKDPATDVIALYLESFGNPRRFARIAAPRVAHEAGHRGEGGPDEGGRARRGHPHRRAARRLGRDGRRPLRPGRRDPHRHLCRAARPRRAALGPARARRPARRRGHERRRPGHPVRGRSRSCRPRASRAGRRDAPQAARAAAPRPGRPPNPVDVLGDATPSRLRDAVAAMAADPDLDALVVLYVPTPPLSADAAAEAIADGLAQRGSGSRSSRPSSPKDRRPRCSATPGSRPSRCRRRPPGRSAPPPAGVDGWLANRRPRHPCAASSTATERRRWWRNPLAAGGGWLAPGEVRSLAACYGLPLCDQRVVVSPQAAGAAAEELGVPVAVKAIAPGSPTRPRRVPSAWACAATTRRVRPRARWHGRLRRSGHAARGFPRPADGRSRRRAADRHGDATRSSDRWSPAPPAASPRSCSPIPRCGWPR